MVIDPQLYEKYSGRSGDPMDRLGAAYAANDKRRSARAAEKHRAQMAMRVSVWRFGLWGMVGRMFIQYPIPSIIAVAVVLGIIGFLATN